VEDDPPVLSATRRVLDALGMQVVAASTVGEALAWLSDSGLRPDLIVADYRLPGGRSGVDLVRSARAAVGEQLPALLITGDILPESVRDMESCECSVLYKPIERDELVAVMNALLGGDDATESSGPESLR
jgi:two-component system CheB/CheR fusion protein